jgi:exosortase/archaeosortase family protein
MNNIIKSPVTKFLLLTFSLYGVWLVLFEMLIKPWGMLDKIITENISYFICLGLDILGHHAHFNIAHHIGETFIYIKPDTHPLIRVGASCNGLELLVLFTIFIICYPGKLTHKLWFIPIGLFLIHLSNIIRNLILTLMVLNQSSWFDLFHRYVFIFLIYGFIFYLWMKWANFQRQIAHETANS